MKMFLIKNLALIFFRPIKLEIRINLGTIERLKTGKEIIYDLPVKISKFELLNGKSLKNQPEVCMMNNNQSREHEFLNDVMSHDINNINQGIIGYIELLLKKDSLDTTTKRYLELIYNQILRSSRIISDVKKIEQIKNSIESCKDVELITKLNNSIERIRDLNPERNIKVDINFDREKLVVNADDYLEDLIYNILSNAVIYNRDNEVEISIKITPESSKDRPVWKISIEDHGDGIPDDLKEIIFNKHERNIFGGKDTGLGLEIVNAIIDRYDSRIWVENRVEGNYTQGSRFNFILNGGGGQ